jgi:pilus assembly protein CpaB
MLKTVLVGMMLIVVAGFGGVVYLSMATPPEVAAIAVAPVAQVTVLAVTKAVQAGNLLKPEDIDKIEMPAAARPVGARPDTQAARAELVGAMVRRNMAALQPVLPADILRPGDGGFLAAVLAPNHRAVSVAVDAVSGTAGLIWPGDRVDLILTQVLDDQSAPAGRRTFGETVLRDVRVIAVDQQLTRGGSPDAAAAGNNMGNRTVTLEVMPDSAERVAVAVRLGRVALVVRAAETQQADRTGVPGQATPNGWAETVDSRPIPTTWGQDVSPALNQRNTASAGATVKVYQGATDKEFKFE